MSLAFDWLEPPRQLRVSVAIAVVGNACRAPYIVVLGRVAGTHIRGVVVLGAVGGRCGQNSDSNAALGAPTRRMAHLCMAITMIVAVVRTGSTCWASQAEIKFEQWTSAAHTASCIMRV